MIRYSTDRKCHSMLVLSVLIFPELTILPVERFFISFWYIRTDIKKMGRKKRSNGASNDDDELDVAKRVKQETAEVFKVKTYRAEKNYASMEAFVRYTKAHRMLDASYVRWNTGVTPEKPFVFSTRVGGTDLGWGRGKSREAAMDCAVRAAFALVNAHGYKNFVLDDDCLMQAPQDAIPPPPPPPPLPPPLPPHLQGMIPPPPPRYVPAPQIVADMIPQPKLAQHVPVASALMTQAYQHQVGLEAVAPMVTPAPISLSFNKQPSSNATSATSLKSLKGGLTLVFDPQSEGPDEMSMEELRASHPRYKSMISRAAHITMERPETVKT
jgi:hypothetical protein